MLFIGRRVIYKEKTMNLYDTVKAIEEAESKSKDKSWYGIPSIKFVWHNEWADPEIEYRGKRCSCYVVEDTMWERWTHDDDGSLIHGREEDYEGFNQYMIDNADEVEYLTQVALGFIK